MTPATQCVELLRYVIEPLLLTNNIEGQLPRLSKQALVHLSIDNKDNRYCSTDHEILYYPIQENKLTVPTEIEVSNSGRHWLETYHAVMLGLPESARRSPQHPARLHVPVKVAKTALRQRKVNGVEQEDTARPKIKEYPVSNKWVGQ